ncbi:MAG: histidine kinase [Williamsia sp.]|nr:histidine kinase [Williamsia sp.]
MKDARFKSYFYPILHLLTWALLSYLLLFYIPLSWHVKVPMVFWIWHCLALVMLMALFYINAGIIVPKTILKNRITAFVLWLLVTTLLMQVIAYLYNAGTGMRRLMSEALHDTVRREHLFDSFIFTMTLIVLSISTSWAMLKNWQRAAQHHQQLEQEKTEAELAMLKNQINPHFFFNTLNSIYSLTYVNVEDSRKALHTLSRMMRYLLYSTDEEKTSLSKEVGFLKDYISLMRLRASDNLKLVVSIPEKLNEYEIAPMLMLPFVENAFKHGVDATASSEIHIVLSQENQHLELDVENYIFAQPEAKVKEDGGIGLLNTRRRLNLIYPDKYRLHTGVNNHGNYEVNLQLELA